MVGVVGSSPIAPTNILPNIKLPDGSVKTFPGPVTVAEVAQSIGAGLARAALAGKVDGRLVDTSFRIEGDAALAIVTDRDPEGLDIIRHSTAHLLAQAVKELYPEAQVTIGPVIENGFYYDFAYKRPFTPEDLAAIEKRMAEIAKRDLPVQRREMPRDAAVSFFRGQGEVYKAEIIASIPDKEAISLYGQGDWVDLCRGPHVPSTGKLKVFKLMRVAGAYWRGDSKNEMLQRIYGTAWAKKEDQDAYLKMLEEAEKRDHRRLGTQLDLFHMQEEAPGLVFWHPKGWTLWQQVEQYMRRVYRDNGYQEVRGPQILDVGLWKRTGHWDNFRENMFFTESEKRALRGKADELPGPHPDLQQGRAQLPRPAAALRRVRLLPPQRALGRAARADARARLRAGRRAHLLHRGTDPGRVRELHGAIARRYTRTSASPTSSTRWPPGPRSESATTLPGTRRSMRCSEALRRSGVEFSISPGEGAFYGPKIEYSLKDAIGRVWQCGTMQVDFSMPGRLGAEYVRRGQCAPYPGDAPPGDRRLDGALPRHPDRAFRRRVSALAGARAGGGDEHLRSTRRTTPKRSRTR